MPGCTPDNPVPLSMGLFAALGESERAAVVRYFTERHLNAGCDLWQAGDAGDYLACIVTGSMELKVDTEFPGKQLVMGVFSAGAVIGASSVLDHLPRMATVKALEPTRVLLLNREQFAVLSQEHPQIGIKLLKGMLLAEASRLRQAYARLASVF